MRTKSLLSIIAVVVLSTSVGYAQIVEATTYDGNPIINCESMPASAYTTIRKNSDKNDLSTNEANQQVFKRFAVCKNDNHTILRNWHEGFTICNSFGDGKWRLPTQRELMLIWVLKDQLNKVSGFTYMLSAYWSATAYRGDDAYQVNFGNDGGAGTVTIYSKLFSESLRCIREL